MKGLKAVFCLAVFLSFSAYGWAEWYPGIIHAHSTFSDGARNPEELISQAKQAGARFLIVTDHYEQIDGLYQSDGHLKLGAKFAVDKAPITGGGYTAEWVLKLGFQDYGFDRYRSRFLAQTSSDFVVIPGAEIELGPPTGVAHDENGNRMHILALGIFEKPFGEIDEVIKKRIHLRDAQRELVGALKKLDFVPVIAHPNGKDPLREGTYTCYTESPTSGFEFFNSDYKKDLESYWEFQEKQGFFPIVTSGCDSHFPKINPGNIKYSDPNDLDRWTRKTWVFSEKLEAKFLLGAMAQGHTYAAQHGASLENLNYIPGFQAQEVERLKFQFFVAFDKKISDSKTIRIYRDGKLIESSVQTHKKENIKGLQKIAYVWEDKGVEAGEHQYVIEVEGVLITSPIRLKIKTGPLPIVGSTPLHKAVEKGDIKIVKLLIKKGADVNAKDQNGNTPLHLAAKKDNFAIAKLLIENGADVNARNKKGNTPLVLTGWISREMLLKLIPVPGVLAVELPRKTKTAELLLEYGGKWLSAGKLTAFVKDQKGRPIAKMDFFLNGVYVGGKTAQTGYLELELTGVPKGNYILYVGIGPGGRFGPFSPSADYETYKRNIDITGEDVFLDTIVVQKYSRIIAKLVDEQGSPVMANPFSDKYEVIDKDGHRVDWQLLGGDSLETSFIPDGEYTLRIKIVKGGETIVERKVNISGDDVAIGEIVIPKEK